MWIMEAKRHIAPNQAVFVLVGTKVRWRAVEWLVLCVDMEMCCSMCLCVGMESVVDTEVCCV